MKKTLLFFLVCITIFIHGKGFWVDATPAMRAEGEFEKEKIIIEQLFQQRSKLWNNIYDETIDEEQWTEKLKNIVVQPLLSFDVEAFENACENPTDIDKVMDLKIIDIENVIYGRDEISARIKMNWMMQGMSSQYEEEIEYMVVLKKEDNKWKLCDYNIYQ